MFDGVLRHFQQCLSYMVAFSFIGGGNRKTRRKPRWCKNNKYLRAYDFCECTM